MHIGISEWLILYPKPKGQSERSKWLSDSRFTEEELETQLEAIRIKFFKPLFAHAVVQLGKDVENAPKPWTKGPARWLLIGSSSAAPTESDVQHVAAAAGIEKNALLESIRLEKNSNLGAILLGDTSESRKHSPWIYEKAGGNRWTIQGVIRLKFDGNGPSALFKNLNAELGPDGTNYLKQPEGPERLRAVMKKLKKAKFVTVMDPESGRPVVKRPKVRVRRRKERNKNNNNNNTNNNNNNNNNNND